MELVKYLEWDSNFFGFNIGRIDIGKNLLDRKILDAAISESVKKNIKCLYLEIPFGPPEILAYCSEKKFLLTDFRIIISKILSEKTNIVSDNITCKLENKFYPALEKIAIQISKQSRYIYDPKFGIEWSSRLYKEWVRKSFCEKFCDDFIIYIDNQEPVGIITLKVKDGVPFIDLLGVLNNKQGKGIGRNLIDNAEKKLYETGYRVLKVITQGHNIKALRLYQSRNFKIENTVLFYHIWTN